MKLTNSKYLIYALLLYLPTIAHMRVELYLLPILAVLIFERSALLEEVRSFRQKPFQRRYLFSFWLVLLIFVTSLINKIVNGNDILCFKDYYAAFYLFPLLILVSKYIGKQEVFKYLIWISAFEAIIVALEYMIGNRALLMDLGDFNEIRDRSLLYSSRCYGLSVNSSVVAYKFMIALILLDFTAFKKWLAWILRVVIVVGVIFSFSRTVVVVIILFWFLRVLYGVYRFMKNREVLNTVAFRFNILIIVLIVLFNSNVRYQISRGDHDAESVFEEIDLSNQRPPETCAELQAIEYKQGETDPEKQGWGEKVMMRTEGVQSSGRKLIWLNYINFIENHLLFGNGSDKVMLRSWQARLGTYKFIHAHNSYLMMLASNGVMISLLYFLFYLFNYRSRNYLGVFAILVYSLLNYGIFWGFSYIDVIFIALLTISLKDSYDQQT